MPSYTYVNIDNRRRFTCNCSEIGRCLTVLVILIAAGITMFVAVDVYKNIRGVSYDERDCITTANVTNYRAGYGSFDHRRFKQVSWGADSICNIHGLEVQTIVWFPNHEKFYPPFNHTFTAKFNEHDVSNAMYDNDIRPMRTGEAILLLLFGIVLSISIIYYAYDPIWKHYLRPVEHNALDRPASEYVGSSVNSVVYSDTELNSRLRSNQIINSSYNLIYLIVLMMMYGVLWMHCD